MYDTNDDRHIEHQLQNGFATVKNILIVMTLLFLCTMILLICVFCRMNVLQKSADFIIQTQHTQLHYMSSS